MKRVCVCVREGEREGKRERGREKELWSIRLDRLKRMFGLVLFWLWHTHYSHPHSSLSSYPEFISFQNDVFVGVLVKCFNSLVFLCFCFFSSFSLFLWLFPVAAIHFGKIDVFTFRHVTAGIWAVTSSTCLFPSFIMKETDICVFCSLHYHIDCIQTHSLNETKMKKQHQKNNVKILMWNVFHWLQFSKGLFWSGFK